jgi:hypothetical protein
LERMAEKRGFGKLAGVEFLDGHSTVTPHIVPQESGQIVCRIEFRYGARSDR